MGLPKQLSHQNYWAPVKRNKPFTKTNARVLVLRQSKKSEPRSQGSVKRFFDAAGCTAAATNEAARGEVIPPRAEATPTENFRPQTKQEVPQYQDLRPASVLKKKLGEFFYVRRRRYYPRRLF